MNYYPIQVFITQWKSYNLLQIGCRPDALAALSAEILVLGGMSAPVISIGSVEHRDEEIASFLISIEVPNFIRTEILRIVDSYRLKD